MFLLSLLSGLGMVFILFLLCLTPPAAITTSDGDENGDFGVVVVVASAVAVLFVDTPACIPTIVVVVDVALVALAPAVVALL